MPNNEGDIYFMVEGYYHGMLPTACKEGPYLDMDGEEFYEGYPIVYMSVSIPEKSYYERYTYYLDQFARPLYFLSSEYEAGDTFQIFVFMSFSEDYPNKDFTVSVYAKDSLDIVDLQGNTNQIHMDGHSPSGFTKSNYCVEESCTK
mmetsp:Transcript_13133/g.22192  ORF Transcript_13133/g.22192 Transcript_13133/m.22192 type:complete len:146 (+) Transcript_13133:1309-1746(+)